MPCNGALVTLWNTRVTLLSFKNTQQLADAYDISRFRFLFVVKAQYQYHEGSSSRGHPSRTFCRTVALKDESCSSRNEVQIKNAPSDTRGLNSGKKLNHWWNNFITSFISSQRPPYWQKEADLFFAPFRSSLFNSNFRNHFEVRFDCYFLQITKCIL